MSDHHDPARGVTRRGFLKGVGVAAVTPSLLSAHAAQASGEEGRVLGEGATQLQLRINGQQRELRVEPRTTLLEALRFDLQLTGAKEVCELGSCGACTVLLDGEPVNACMTLAVDCEGKAVTTIEGIAKPGELHPLSAAFTEEDALQCGYCTPGMIMSSYACLTKNPDASLPEIQDALSGNLCRCGTYTRICDAVQKAQKTMKGGR